MKNGHRQPFCEQKSCVLIWNGEKCDRKWFLVIHNGRQQPFWGKIVYLSEMARNAIESDFWSSKMATGSHIVNKKSKLRIDLKWREMRTKFIFGHPKWPPAAILWKKCVFIWNGEKCDRKWFLVIQNGHRQPFCEKKIKIVYLSEMARNAIESDFRSSKMATSSHFVKKKSKLRIDLKCREMQSKVIFGHPTWPPAAILWTKLCIYLKWREMRSKVIFGHPKWPPAAILWKKIKVAYWSEMVRNAIESDFRSSKMATGSHFVKRNKNCVFIWNGKKCDRKWFSVIQNGHQQPFCEKKNQSCVLIWNAEKCNRKWFLVIQHGRRQPFCEQNCVFIWNGEKCDRKYWWKNQKNKVVIDLKCREMRSKVIFGHPKWPPVAI